MEKRAQVAVDQNVDQNCIKIKHMQGRVCGAVKISVSPKENMVSSKIVMKNYEANFRF
jgi:hypothetical protein